jgi:DNA-binding Lrp family transcriptional regulator
MAKNSRQQIEEDERKIIQELLRNANKSINEIAKNCGFSRQKVWRIIKNLEKNNTIWGYVAVTDEEKLDKKGYVVLIKRTNLPLNKNIIDKIIERELESKSNEIGIELTNSLYTNGPYDWIICFDAPDIKSAKRFCENLNRVFEGYISRLELLEKMFAAKKCGIQNPEIEELRKLFDLE